MGGPEVEAFLNHLASERHLSASSQTQALNALVFLYDSVLRQPLGEMAGLKRVQRRHRIPVVLARDEVKAILEHMTDVVRLMAELMYGAGLRVNECMTLRVKDIDFSGGVLNVRSGKGGNAKRCQPVRQPLNLARLVATGGLASSMSPRARFTDCSWP